MTHLQAAVDEVAAKVCALAAAHPLRIGIDGFCAAGKSTFAAQLAAALASERRPVIRATTDDFQHPPEIRWQLGPDSPQGFYQHAIDFTALRRELLDPIRCGAAYRTTFYDLRNRRPNLSPVATAGADSVLIVDGLFLHAPAVRSSWDYSVFIDADPEICVRRALRRNQEGQADLVELERTYRVRYMPGWALYMAEHDPKARATFTFCNSADSGAR